MLVEKWLWTLKGRSLENGKKWCECSPFLIRQLRPITWTPHNIYIHTYICNVIEQKLQNFVVTIPQFFFSGKWDNSQSKCDCLGNSRRLILYCWALMVLQRRKWTAVSIEIFEYLCFSNVMWGDVERFSKIVLLPLDVRVKLNSRNLTCHYMYTKYLPSISTDFGVYSRTLIQL
jgi:hypothetical protein